MIQEVDNIELFELLETDPKTQCKVCLSYWDTGIVYRTCGHFLRKGREEKSEIHQVHDGPSFTPRVCHQEGKTSWATDTGKSQVTKNIIWLTNWRNAKRKKFQGIHDRFSLDHDFRARMIDNNRDEEVCRRWDVLAEKDHTYYLSEKEKEYYYNKNKWCLHLNKSGSDTPPFLRKRYDFKQALFTLERLHQEESASSSSSAWWELARLLVVFLPFRKSRKRQAKSWERTERPVVDSTLAKTSEDGFQEFNLFCSWQWPGFSRCVTSKNYGYSLSWRWQNKSNYNIKKKTWISYAWWNRTMRSPTPMTTWPRPTQCTWNATPDRHSHSLHTTSRGSSQCVSTHLIHAWSERYSSTLSSPFHQTSCSLLQSPAAPAALLLPRGQVETLCTPPTRRWCLRTNPTPHNFKRKESISSRKLSHLPSQRAVVPSLRSMLGRDRSMQLDTSQTSHQGILHSSTPRREFHTISMPESARLRVRISWVKFWTQELLLWIRSSRIPTTRRRSVWTNRKLRKRIGSFAEDRSLTWSTTTSGLLALMISVLDYVDLIYSQLLFALMMFRKSIRDVIIDDQDSTWWRLGKFVKIENSWVPATFACWKIRFKTEVCTCSQFPTEAMQWIKEVELVDSVGWIEIFVIYSWDFNAELWSTRCEDCSSDEQNNP